MSPPLSVEQRLAVSRVQCLAALRQPTWLLLAQRVCATPTHPPHNPSGSPAQTDFWQRCLKSFL